MPNRRHSSRRFTPSCSNNITNSCRCDMIDCSDHGTPAPPPQANNADTMRQPCPRTPVHYLSRPYRGKRGTAPRVAPKRSEGGRVERGPERSEGDAKKFKQKELKFRPDFGCPACADGICAGFE